jgi:hypothetical protein
MSTESDLVRHQSTASSLQNNNSDFHSSKVIILSELNDIQREQYYNLILSNDVKINNSDKKFVANVRLLALNKEETEKCEQKVDSVLVKEGEEGKERSFDKSGINNDNKRSSSVKKPSGSSFKSRRHGLLYGTKGISKMLSFHIAGVAPFDYSVFSRFCSLIGDEAQTVRPKLRSVSWLMRIIEGYSIVGLFLLYLSFYYLCIFSLFMPYWLVYVSHVEDRFFNIPRLQFV